MEFAKKECDDYILIDFSTAEQAVKDNFENIGKVLPMYTSQSHTVLQPFSQEE